MNEVEKAKLHSSGASRSILLSLTVVAAACASLHCLAGEIVEKWVYPLRPGTPEWAARDTTQQTEFDATQIPLTVVTNMPTEVLLKSCLDFPLKGHVYFNNTSREAGLQDIVERFFALADLLKRSDLSTYIAREFQSFDYVTAYFPVEIVKSRIGQVGTPRVNAIDHQFLLLLVQRREVCSCLTESDSKKILVHLLKQLAHVRDTFGVSENDFGITKTFCKLTVANGFDLLPSSASIYTAEYRLKMEKIALGQSPISDFGEQLLAAHKALINP